MLARVSGSDSDRAASPLCPLREDSALDLDPESVQVLAESESELAVSGSELDCSLLHHHQMAVSARPQVHHRHRLTVPRVSVPESQVQVSV